MPGTMRNELHAATVSCCLHVVCQCGLLSQSGHSWSDIAVVVNSDGKLQQCVQQMDAIIQAEKCKIQRLTP